MVERLDWTDIYHDDFGVDFLIDNEEAEEVTWEADFDGVQPPTFTENDAWSNWSDFYGRKPKYIFPFRPRSVLVGATRSADQLMQDYGIARKE